MYRNVASISNFIFLTFMDSREISIDLIYIKIEFLYIFCILDNKQNFSLRGLKERRKSFRQKYKLNSFKRKGSDHVYLKYQNRC